MDLARKIVIAAVVACAVSAAPGARAAVCLPSTDATPPVPYTPPSQNFNVVFKLTTNPDSKYPQIAYERYRVKSVEGDSVRWFREPMHGKGPTEDLTLYRAFARTEGNGWVYKFEQASYDKLWPLKQGKEAEYVLSAQKDGKEVMKLKAQFCVRGNKVLKLEAGEYKGYLVDFSQVMVKGPENNPWDTIEVQAWYVPQFGTALLIEDRVLKNGRIVMVRRREATELAASETPEKKPEKKKEPASPQQEFPKFVIPGAKDGGK